MAARKLNQDSWRGYCDRVSKALLGKRAEIEVTSLAIGDQIEAEWLPVLGITYDAKNNLVEVALDGLDHLIHEPQELYVEEGADGLETIEIVAGDGIRQIIKLREPLMLPSSSTASP